MVSFCVLEFSPVKWSVGARVRDVKMLKEKRSDWNV